MSFERAESRHAKKRRGPQPEKPATTSSIVATLGRRWSNPTVDPDGACHHARQRQGVGSLLIEKIHEEASHRGLVRLYSDVSITAKPFFIAKGFEVIKEQLIAIRGQELSNFRMQKHLEHS
jgi:GNAT superfamily N-acetyltransferase